MANSDLLKFELCARTGTPPSTVEVPLLTELIVIQGTKNTTKAAAAGDAKPVSNVTFEGVTFTGQRPTYMEPHGLPSGYVSYVHYSMRAITIDAYGSGEIIYACGVSSSGAVKRSSLLRFALSTDLSL